MQTTKLSTFTWRAWLLDPRCLARLYETTDAYDKADPLYLESVAIRSEVLGKKHVDYTVGLDNLGDFTRQQVPTRAWLFDPMCLARST